MILTKHEIAFIDRNVDSLTTLLAGLRPQVEPILLSDDEPGPRQMAAAIRHRMDLTAIHVVAHGRPGEISFGSGTLAFETLENDREDLAAIGNALGTDGNHIPTIVVGAGVDTRLSYQVVNNYSPLHTIDNIYGLPALGASASAPVMSLTPATPATGYSQIATSFSGISDASTYPPHNGLAVGPNNIVMAEGSRIEWTNLAGGAPTLESAYSFFSSLNPTGDLYDPRCAYDSINQRYIVIMDYLASGATISNIDIAVFKDFNPNDGWYFASLNTSLTINNQLTASDRPMLSVDLHHSTSVQRERLRLRGNRCWVIGDTAGARRGIYNGGTLTVTANQLTPSNQGAS